MQRQEILEHARLVNAVVGLESGVDTVEVVPAIVRSWHRCVHDFGLDPLRDEPVVVLSSSEAGKVMRKPPCSGSSVCGLFRTFSILSEKRMLFINWSACGPSA